MRLLAFFCLAMFFCLPFNHALAINFVACPSVVLAILFVGIGVMVARPTRAYFSNSDFLILGFWALLCVSFGFGTKTSTAINHWIAYATFILIVYFGCGRTIFALIENKPAFWNKILTTISVMIFITCVYGIVDWTVLFLTGSDIPIPRSMGGGYGSAAGVGRARSFLGEPSFLSNFLLAWVPLAFWYEFSQRGKYIWKTLFLVAVVAVFLLTFSVKGFCEVLFAAPVLIGIYLFKKGIRVERIIFFAVIALVVVAVLLATGFGQLLFDAVSVKFFGSDIANDRADRGLIILDLMSGYNWIFGYGPASYVTLTGGNTAGGGTSFLSGVAYLLGDSGILGLTLFSLFLFVQLFFVKKLKIFGLKLAFAVTIYTSAAGEIIEPTHYSPSLYLMIILLHAAVAYQDRIWKKPLPRHAPLPPFPPNAPVPLPPGALPPPQKISFHENSSHY